MILLKPFCSEVSTANMVMYVQNIAEYPKMRLNSHITKAMVRNAFREHFASRKIQQVSVQVFFQRDKERKKCKTFVQISGHHLYFQAKMYCTSIDMLVANSIFYFLKQICSFF